VIKYSLKFRIFDDLVSVMNFIAIRHMYERYIIIKLMKFKGSSVLVFFGENMGF
jgi:hypothetical protein